MRDKTFFLIIAAILGFTAGVALSIVGIFIAGMASFLLFILIFATFYSLKRFAVKRHIKKLDKELKQYEDH